jgi:hypothetical protein
VHPLPGGSGNARADLRPEGCTRSPSATAVGGRSLRC